MKIEEIKSRLLQAMSTLRGNSNRYKVVEREEITYFLDPSNILSQLVRIDDTHPDLEKLILEFSDATRGKSSAVITFPEQNTQLFELLKREGYEPEERHDICYQLVSEHSFQSTFLPARPQTRLIQTKTDLLSQQKIAALSFGQPYKERTEEAIQQMLKEYSSELPQSVRFLAFETNMENQTDEILGTGGMSLFDDLGVATLLGGCTIPSARNRGVYSALIDARIRYAQERNIPLIGIYANQETSAPIVQKLGFKKCGEMLPWRRQT